MIQKNFQCIRYDMEHRKDSNHQVENVAKHWHFQKLHAPKTDETLQEVYCLRRLPRGSYIKWGAGIHGNTIARHDTTISCILFGIKGILVKINTHTLPYSAKTQKIPKHMLGNVLWTFFLIPNGRFGIKLFKVEGIMNIFKYIPFGHKTSILLIKAENVDEYYLSLKQWSIHQN